MRVLIVLLLAACQGSPKNPVPEPSASLATAASAAPSASAAPPAAWYQGTWQGTYKAELRRIELAVGGVREWKKDDGSQASGDGTLSLEVEADGSVSGTAGGALGAQTVSGRIEGEHVALSLLPSETNGFQGTLLAARTPEGIQGTLSASTGDSLVVRQASVTLSKAGK